MGIQICQTTLIAVSAEAEVRIKKKNDLETTRDHYKNGAKCRIVWGARK